MRPTFQPITIPHNTAHKYTHTLAVTSVSVNPRPNQHANEPTLLSVDSRTRLTFQKYNGEGDWVC